jgi:FAD-dependent urate hydroxylase
LTSSVYTASKAPAAPSTPDFDVVIVGAGPYGLSAASYLQESGLKVCVFGEPMDFWANQMPAGMLLRSPRAASTISDPRSRLTLEAYEAASGLRTQSPLPSEVFVSYGRWFQTHLNSSWYSARVQEVRQEKSLFRVIPEHGQSLLTRRVIVATGIGPFAKKPEAFEGLPPETISHCYEGRRLSEFAQKRVAVIGSGQSALESAALLREAGAQVEVIARVPQLRWIGGHKWLHQLGPVSRMLYSKYDVGPLGISRLVASPNIVSRIPLGIKDRIRLRAVKPAGAPWLVPRLKGVTMTMGRTVRSAKTKGEEIRVTLDDGSERRFDHILLGTGYRVDVSGYRFLAPSLVSGIRHMDGYPALGEGLCGSVPGLHFIGAAAAKCFGPLLYFVAGTEFASRQLTAYVSRNRKIVSV